jgi:hypothetical protein
MISYFASVSLSLRAEVPVPVVSRRRISISMCFSFMRTCSASQQCQNQRVLAMLEALPRGPAGFLINMPKCAKYHM